jgi:hypothetical protein
MNEVQYFGAPKNDSTNITIMFKNEKEEINFGVGDKQMEVFNEMCQFVKNTNNQNTIIPDEGELPYGLV